MKKYYLILFAVLLLASILRLYRLGENPPSPYWEEAALGFDAYSVLSTGKDHHGNILPLVAFESFGDWKPSLYFYLTALSELFLGLNVFAVRLPSALAAIGTLVICFLVVRLLLKGRLGLFVALVSSLLLAISPWHLLVSRVGFESNVALFLTVSGLYFFIKTIKTKSIGFSILASLLWGLSLYTYHSSRLLIPLLFGSLSLLYLQTLLQKKALFAVSAMILFIFSLPILNLVNSPQVKQRFQETSAFATIEPVIRSNEAIVADGSTRLAKLLHHRFWYYSEIFLTSYLSHYDPQFLFISGDQNRRHSVGLSGQLLLISGPLILFGIYFMVRKKEHNLLPILLFTILAPVPAAFTTATPHALRALPMVFGFSIFAGYGFVQLIDSIGRKKVLKMAVITTIALIAFYQTVQFWHYYWHGYRKEYSREWQYGYEPLMEYIQTVSTDYDEILISRGYGRPAMYFWFYTRTNPESVQNWNLIASKDQGEYLEFENLSFTDALQSSDGKQLFISTKEVPEKNAVKVIYDLQGNPVFYAYEN